MKTDTVVTVAIGRNYGRNKFLSNSRWRSFRRETKNLIGSHAKIVATTHGKGIGSDGARKNKSENTFVVVAVNPVKVNQLRQGFVGLLPRYNQTSLAFAVDRKHKPVFDLTRSTKRSKVKS